MRTCGRVSACGVARRGRVDQRGAGGIDAGAAGDEVVGDRAGDAELARRVLDRGDAVPLLGPGALGRGVRPRPGSAPGAAAGAAAGSASARRRGSAAPRPRRGPPRAGVGSAGAVAAGAAAAAASGGVVSVSASRVMVGSSGMGAGVRRRRWQGWVAGSVGWRRLPGGAEAGGGVGADRHGGELERLPVDGAPDRRLAVGLGDLVAADRVADRDVAHDAGGDVAPDRLDVGPVGEAHRGAADERLALAGDPGPLDDADDVAQVPGAVGVEERRAAVQPAEIDVRLLERQHLVVALAGPGIAPAHRGAGRPDQLDGAPLGVDALRHQPDVGPGLQRQIDACAAIAAVRRIRRLRRHPASPAAASPGRCGSTGGDRCRG